MKRFSIIILMISLLISSVFFSCSNGRVDFTGQGPTDVNAPTNLTATADTQNQVTLTWEDNSDYEQGFIIERADLGKGNFSEIAKVNSNVTTYTDKNLSVYTKYEYRVKAYAYNIYSKYSNTAEVRTYAGFFSHTYNYAGEANLDSYSVAEIPSGGYLVVTRFYTEKYLTAITKVDDEGNLLWSKLYEFKDSSENDVETIPFKIEALNGDRANTNFIVLGVSRSNGGEEYIYHSFLMKIDEDGNSSWFKFFSKSGYEFQLYDSVIDGSYLIFTGYAYNNATSERDLYAGKVNISDGSILWSKLFYLKDSEGGNSYSDYGTSIIKDSDGNYLVYGFSGIVGARRVSVWLLKFSSNGTLLTSNFYYNTDLSDFNPDNWGIDSLIQSADGNYVMLVPIAGTYLVVKINKQDFSIIWAKFLNSGDYFCTLYSIINGYDLNGKNVYIAAGATDYINMHYSGLVVQIDEDGQFLKQKVYFISDNSGKFGKVLKSRYGYIFAGYNGIGVRTINNKKFNRNINRAAYGGALWLMKILPDFTFEFNKIQDGNISDANIPVSEVKDYIEVNNSWTVGEQDLVLENLDGITLNTSDIQLTDSTQALQE